MAKPRSVKDLLTSEDFFQSRAKAQKYVKHEFQDYAYRLAVDMGDLQHRPIYMRLAKSVDRVTLEQAAAFAKDYTKEVNKGKIFMWKLAELRAAAQFKRDLQNCDYEFVMQRMSELYSGLAPALAKKQEAALSTQLPSLQKLVQLLNPDVSAKRKQKVLVLGSGGGSEAGWLSGCHLMVTGVEVSANLTKLAKRNYPEVKFVGKKNFLQNAFPAASFAGVWCGRMWQVLPLEIEQKYLTELAKLAKPGGWIYLEILLAEADSQKWEEFALREERKMRFVKKNALDALEAKCRKAGFKCVDSEQLAEGKVGLYLQLKG